MIRKTVLALVALASLAGVAIVPTTASAGGYYSYSYDNYYYTPKYYRSYNYYYGGY